MLRALEIGLALVIAAAAVVLAYAVRRWEPVDRDEAGAAASSDPIVVDASEQGVRIALADELVELAGIETAPVQRKVRAEFVEAPASLQFARSRYYRAVARFDGRLSAVHCDVGSEVKAGDVLCMLQSDVVTETKSALLRGLAHYEAASETYDRLVTLRETKLVRQQDLIDARRDLEEAKVAIAAARERLASWGLSAEEIEAVIRRQDLSASIPVRSPINGRVLKLPAVQGQTVKVGDLLAEVADASVLWGEILVEETHVALLHEGQPVTFHPSAAGLSPISGRLFFVTPQVDQRTRKVTVWAELNNEPGLYRAGMFGTARVEVAPARERFFVPATAVQQAEGLTWVFVQGQPGEYELRRVQIGISDGDQVEVRYGLNGTERVVAQGAFFLLAEILRQRPELITPCTEDHGQ